MIRAVAASWLPPLLTHLWESTLFLLLILCVIAALRSRLTAGARCSLALVGIAKFAIPSAALRSLFPAHAAGPIAVPLQVLGGALNFPSRPVAPSVWPVLIVGFWAVVALMFIARMSLTRHRLVVIAVRTAVPAQPREVEALNRAKRRLGLRRSVDIIRSALPEAPAVLRIVRPLVVLPSHGCDDLSDEELESLLCHESAHVARYDNLAARIESFICALFWFHPLIWIAQRVTVMERERACDEVVAASADERETYLAALTKFCHAAIAPRLPGVSCMATAKLKERIDHIMRFPMLKTNAPSVARVTLAATAALVLFTVGSALTGSGRAFAKPSDEAKPYSIRLRTTKNTNGKAILTVTIEESSTGHIVASPAIPFEGQQDVTATNDAGFLVHLKLRNVSNARSILDVVIDKDGETVQKSTMMLVPSTETPSRVYTGAPITMDLKDADIRDVLTTFGKLTGLQMHIADDVQGKVTVSWHDVPWDEAFDALVKENGLTWRISGNDAYIDRAQ